MLRAMVADATTFLALIAQLDAAVDAWLRAHASDSVTAAMTLISRWHRPRVMATAATALAVVAALRRDATALWLVLAGVFGGAALNAWLKAVVAHPRPHAIVGAASDYAFPSGHVAWATLLYGCVAVLVISRTGRRPLKAAAVVAWATVVALVAASRLVLGAHHVSDVVAAAAVASAWLAACWWVSSRRRGRR